MTSLRQFIRDAINAEWLESQFTANAVKGLAKKIREEGGSLAFDPKNVTATLNNNSEGPGNRRGAAVQRGGAAWLTKHENKSFSLRQNVGKSPAGAKMQTAQINPPIRKIKGKQSVDSTKAPRAEPTTENEAALRFVDYLENMPFRILKKGTGRGRYSWHPQEGAACGWNERLSAYEWNDKNWKDTESKIKEFTRNLDSLEKQWKKHPGSLELQKTAKDIYDEIKKWGNERGKDRDAEEVLSYLVKLWDKNEIDAVDSTLTKLYAFARPNKYVIYDSRVAMAIVRIAEFMYPVKTKENRQHDTVEDFKKFFKHLGTVDGVGGTRLGAVFRQKWPRARTKVKAQYEANRLCKAIVNSLNDQKVGGRTDWKLREVEAVLFMEGY